MSGTRNCSLFWDYLVQFSISDTKAKKCFLQPTSRLFQVHSLTFFNCSNLDEVAEKTESWEICKWQEEFHPVVSDHFDIESQNCWIIEILLIYIWKSAFFFSFFFKGLWGKTRQDHRLDKKLSVAIDCCCLLNNTKHLEIYADLLYFFLFDMTLIFLYITTSSIYSKHQILTKQDI